MAEIPGVDILLRSLAGEDKPWLILGKGPSHKEFQPELGDRFVVCALNHAMRGVPAAAGHAIDLEVLDQLAGDDLAGIDNLIVPFVPHIRQKRPLYKGKTFFGPGGRTLAQLVETNAILQDYLRRGRLFTYNLSSAPNALRRPDLPVVDARTFSASAVVRLLATHGVRCIRTLGIDGGNAYGTAFKDIEGTTKLQTHQSSFDSQFKEIAATMSEYSVDFGPLNVQIPAQVFVGCMPEQELAFEVLKYSIEKHSSITVEVHQLHESVRANEISVPEPKNPKNRGRTPFSFQRFAIPRIRKFKGRAVYVDSDMLVLKDLRELWLTPMGEHQMLSAASCEDTARRPQFSVMLINCETLHWECEKIVEQLDGGELTYEQVMYEMATVPSWRAGLSHHWNSLEAYDPDETRLIHFTDMDGQPWLNAWHGIGALWCQYLIDAINDGAITRDDVKRQVDLGNVRPSLLVQVDRAEPDARRLPLAVLLDDLKTFFPPHRRASAKHSRIKHELYRTRLLISNRMRDDVVSPAIRGARQLASSILKAMTK